MEWVGGGFEALRSKSCLLSLTASGMLHLFGLCIARVFALPRSSLRVSVTINQPVGLSPTYRIPETLFSAGLHNVPVVCFCAVWEPKQSDIRL